ncbi:hypothetical protein GB937_004317 [Aspergillus fischeri]|nr:hypothetical protein GB937_004317 [Aspergillus fischeri]
MLLAAAECIRSVYAAAQLVETCTSAYHLSKMLIVGLIQDNCPWLVSMIDFGKRGLGGHLADDDERHGEAVLSIL